jgi:RNA polymerase sigma factor (sigma-70 family)
MRATVSLDLVFACLPGRLSLDERHALALRARDGDRLAEERLLVSCMGLVRMLASRVARARGCDPEDLFAAGLRATLDAIRRYDGNGRLASYLFASARGAILREADALSSAVTVPAHLKRVLRLVRRGASSCVAAGAAPEEALESAFQAALELEVSRGRRIHGGRLRSAHAATARAVVPIAPADERAGAGAWIPDRRSRRAFEAIEARLDAAAIMRTMTARERAVLERRFGLRGDGERSLREVGREMALSQEGVRRIEMAALGRARAAVGAA